MGQYSYLLHVRRDYLDLTINNKIISEKEVINELREQWRQLWNKRRDDSLKAESIATQTYPSLFVERGTVIHASRDFKPLSFKEILSLHQIDKYGRYLPLTPEIGGWGKFVKTHINTQKKPLQKHKLIRHELKKERTKSNKKKSGWLHK